MSKWKQICWSVSLKFSKPAEIQICKTIKDENSWEVDIYCVCVCVCVCVWSNVCRVVIVKTSKAIN